MVSFTLTTHAEQRMTPLQFWLAVVFGATEVGFIASGIATWSCDSGLARVVLWTLGGHGGFGGGADHGAAQPPAELI